MNLAMHLKEFQNSIVEQWVESIFKTYPLDTVGFLRTQKNAFSNPIGHTTEQATHVIYTALYSDEYDEKNFKQAIANIVKIRAIQNFTPSMACGIFFLLKDCIKNTLSQKLTSVEDLNNLVIIFSKIDSVALMAFDTYSTLKELVYKERAEEYRRAHSQILRRAEKLEERYGPQEILDKEQQK